LQTIEAELTMDATQTQDALITYEDAAQALNVSPVTIQLWVEGHVIAGLHSAEGEKRVSQKAVLQLIKDRSNGPSTGGNRLTDGPSSRRLRVLIVEDSDVLAKLYVSVISEWNLGIDLTIAHNGFEGLVQVGAMRPDLVITDLDMPGMNGFQMIRTLQKPGPGYVVPVFIAVSGMTEDAMQSRGGLPPGVQFLPKPLNFDAVRKLVEALLPTVGSVSPSP
jgi:CheY-like chemotaxis protein